jgi:hypothetical protein
MYGPKAKAETDVNKKRQKKEKEKNFCICHHKKRERERKRETRVIMTTTSTTLASLLKDDKSKVATLVACGASAAALIYYNREVRNQIANIFMVRRRR